MEGLRKLLFVALVVLTALPCMAQRSSEVLPSKYTFRLADSQVVQSIPEGVAVIIAITGTAKGVLPWTPAYPGHGKENALHAVTAHGTSRPYTAETERKLGVVRVFPDQLAFMVSLGGKYLQFEFVSGDEIIPQGPLLQTQVWAWRKNGKCWRMALDIYQPSKRLQCRNGMDREVQYVATKGSAVPVDCTPSQAPPVHVAGTTVVNNYYWYQEGDNYTPASLQQNPIILREQASAAPMAFVPEAQILRSSAHTGGYTPAGFVAIPTDRLEKVIREWCDPKKRAPVPTPSALLSALKKPPTPKDDATTAPAGANPGGGPAPPHVVGGVVQHTGTPVTAEEVKAADGKTTVPVPKPK